jgi:hypothetical protein
MKPCSLECWRFALDNIEERLRVVRKLWFAFVCVTNPSHPTRHVTAYT